MIKLYEIPFINGYTEFLEYFSREITVNTDSNYTEFQYIIELDEFKIIEKSFTFSFPEKVFSELEVSLLKEDGRYYAVFKSNKELKNLKVIISYTYENLDPKYLYSIDYIEGIIHFSEKTDKEYKIKYISDNIITTGKEVRQMQIEEFNQVESNINIRNPKDNTSIFFLYKNDVIEHRNITPLLQDIKINYILKDDLSI